MESKIATTVLLDCRHALVLQSLLALAVLIYKFTGETERPAKIPRDAWESLVARFKTVELRVFKTSVRRNQLPFMNSMKGSNAANDQIHWFTGKHVEQFGCKWSSNASINTSGYELHVHESLRHILNSKLIFCSRLCSENKACITIARDTRCPILDVRMFLARSSTIARSIRTRRGELTFRWHCTLTTYSTPHNQGSARSTWCESQHSLQSIKPWTRQ